MSRFQRLTTRRVVAQLAHVDDCRGCGELATTVRIDRLTGLCDDCADDCADDFEAVS